MLIRMSQMIRAAKIRQVVHPLAVRTVTMIYLLALHLYHLLALRPLLRASRLPVASLHRLGQRDLPNPLAGPGRRTLAAIFPHMASSFII